MSANIKASVDGTQAIIGVGGVDQMTVSNAGVVTANSFVGNVTGNVTGGTISGTISGNASSATALATGSTTARTLANRFADVVNVKDFGAIGNGVADDTAAIQAALNSGKAIVFLPEGNYKITAPLVISENVTLEGTLQPMTTGALWDGATNTWRIPTDTSVIQVAFGSGSISQTNSAIRLQNNSCIRGISFYYPSQSFSSPSLYPPTISLKIIPTGDPVTERIYGIVIDSCHFCNPWIAIEFTEFHGRSLIRNLCGYAFKNFLYIDNGWEVNRVENIQLNPINTFYGNWPANYILNWQFVDKANTAIKIGKSDLCELKDCFCFGFWTGINIGQFSTYQANGIFITNGGFESSARNVVLETNFRRIIFTNVQFGTAATTSGWNTTPANWPACKAISIFRSSLSTTPNEVKFVNCQIFRSVALAMDVTGCNDLSVINCGFYNSNSLDQGFSTQVLKTNNCNSVKLLDNVVEQNGTNVNGNYINIISTTGFNISNNTYLGQTKVSPAIFVNTSTAGRLNNNIEDGVLSQGVTQAGSTDVVSTNFVQY